MQYCKRRMYCPSKNKARLETLLQPVQTMTLKSNQPHVRLRNITKHPILRLLNSCLKVDEDTHNIDPYDGGYIC